MRFAGAVGFAKNKETEPGVYEDDIQERVYRGTVSKFHRNTDQGDQINDDLNISNTISIIADAFANQNLFSIRYVVWMGTKWKVTSVDVARPRLTLTIGGVYNGE